MGALLGRAGSGLLTPVAALPVGDGVAGAHPTAVARTTAPRTTGIPRRILITDHGADVADRAAPLARSLLRGLTMLAHLVRVTAGTRTSPGVVMSLGVFPQTAANGVTPRGGGAWLGDMRRGAGQLVHGGTHPVEFGHLQLGCRRGNIAGGGVTDVGS